MPINYYTVLNDLATKEWELCSDEYNNLQDGLEMKCPQGHLVVMSYGQWRKRPICPKCLAGDPYKIKNKITPKNPTKTRVLALDAATGTTGYSIYDDKDLIKYGHYSLSSEHEITERINGMKKWAVALCNEAKPDKIFLEHIQLQEYGKGEYQVELYRKLANLQGVLLDTFFELNLPCKLVMAKQWKSYCGIKSRNRSEQKKETQQLITIWYGLSLTEDESDAVCIGKYGCNHTGGFYES